MPNDLPTTGAELHERAEAILGRDDYSSDEYAVALEQAASEQAGSARGEL
jgi:hypothetical protein